VFRVGSAGRGEPRRTKRIRLTTGMAAVILALALEWRTGLLWLEGDAQDGFANTELGVVD
jgi:hypothetical protein